MFVLKAKNLTKTALLAAVLCLLAPWSVPVGTVPVTLATFAVSLVGLLGGVKNGSVAVLIYIAVGLVGVPVFSGFRGGAYVILDLTGGFILGYLPLCLCVALFTRKRCTFLTVLLGQLVGTLILYACGTAWYCLCTGSNLKTALLVCVIPFVLFDIIKMLIPSLIAPKLVGVINIHRGDRL